MKLIIDIPEDYYEVIKKIDDDKCTADMLIIKYGKPFNKELQEIRQELEQAQKYKMSENSTDIYIDRDNALDIIDTKIKELSE